VAKAGYIEVPSRIEEQTRGVQGDWVGWGHHHWLVDVGDSEIEFAFKHQVIHGRPKAQFPYEFYAALLPELRIQMLWWEGSFDSRERFLMSEEEVEGYLAEFVAAHLPTGTSFDGSQPSVAQRAARRVRRLL
jgi:hypothetical protein